MITCIITNHVKPGHKEEYIAVSRSFSAAIVAEGGCLESKVYDNPANNDVINIQVWPDKETFKAVTKTKVFSDFKPLLEPHFEGNELLFLQEV